MVNSADPDQLASSTDLDLHFLQNRVYPGSAGQGLSRIVADDILKKNIIFHRN